jgi:hypothetical protein
MAAYKKLRGNSYLSFLNGTSQPKMYQQSNTIDQNKNKEYRIKLIKQ